MNRILILIPLIFMTFLAFSEGEEDGHMHGPDGRHIVTEQDANGASSFILSHHDMRVEGPDGKSILGVEVNSTISPKDEPGKPVHTEKNVYEPENEVYGSHMTYTEPGEYVLQQAVKMPNGRELKVEFPVYVPPAELVSGQTVEKPKPDGPNFLLLGGGMIAALAALVVAFKMGKKSAGTGLAGLLIVALVFSLLPGRALAQEEEEGHMHGPDGRHVVTESAAANVSGPQLRAYPGLKREQSATRTVDGVTFVLSIENEEVKPDPDLISISKAHADLIGLMTAPVEVSSSAGGLQTTGKVSANPNGIVLVNARTGGRVIRLGALPGTTVSRGQLLATIESTELADAQAAYRRAKAEESQSQAGVRIAEASMNAARTDLAVATRNFERQKRMANAGEFASPTLEAAQSAVSEAQAKRETKETEVNRLTALLSRLRAGLASGVVAQREVDRTEAELSQAKSELADAASQFALAQDALRREESIVKQGLRNAREVDLAQSHVDQAKSALKTAESRALQARADVSRVQSSIRVASDHVRLLGGIPGGGHIISIVAPIEAEVEHRFVSVGQTVAQGEKLYDLLNADVVWVLADVYENDIPKVRIGQTIEVVADAYPEDVYEGEVAFIHNEVNPDTRTSPVRIVIKNSGERLKQNMFVRVILGTGAGDSVVVPAAALQKDKGLDIVFVEEKAGVYRRTLVQVKGSSGNRVIVEGVKPGRSVATSGSYQLMSLGGGK